jgi:hypothetical protein
VLPGTVVPATQRAEVAPIREPSLEQWDAVSEWREQYGESLAGNGQLGCDVQFNWPDVTS